MIIFMGGVFFGVAAGWLLNQIHREYTIHKMHKENNWRALNRRSDRMVIR